MYLYIYALIHIGPLHHISTHFCTSWSPVPEAFKKLLRDWHPDKNVDRVQVCTAVFQCLGDAMVNGKSFGIQREIRPCVLRICWFSGTRPMILLFGDVFCFQFEQPFWANDWVDGSWPDGISSKATCSNPGRGIKRAAFFELGHAV